MSTLIEALFETVGDPLWIVSPALALTRANTPLEALRAAGFDPLSPWGRDLALRVLAGRSVSADAHVVVNGVRRTFRVSGAPAGADGAVFVARDVTDVRPADHEDRLELAVTRIFAAGRPLQEALDQVVEFIAESDGWDCALLWLVNPAAPRLELAALWSRPGVDATRFHALVRELHFDRGHGIPGRAWQTADVVWVPDLLDETGVIRAEAAASAGLHCAVAVPLRETDRVVGVLEVLTRAVRPMSEQLRRSLAGAGDSLGRLIVRHQLTELIERKGQEWSLTFDAIQLPVFITRMDGTIVRLNHAARGLAGGEFTDILGQSIRMASREPWTTLGDVVEAVRDSQTHCSAQIAVSDAHWDVTASLYRSASDEEERVIVAMRDTTEVTRLQDSVRRGEQLAALGELVAGVAHEVRNPIFGMGLTVDALEESLRHDAEIMELFGILRAWLDRLNRLMENLLEYGKTWTLDLREGTIDGVVAGVVDRCRQIAWGSEITIAAEIEPGLTLLMDENRLSHAFENLIHNAIQHSRAGQAVTVRVCAAGPSTIACEVRDDGPGFDPADLPRVFQPFFTRRRGGTGLGLSIVQRIVEEHGGTIAARNADHGGAVLAMRFPVYRRSTDAE
jgi:signal transduction histidine kinase